MNLKKIGSVLTAVSMIASMATYVPAAVSAAEATPKTYTGTLEDTVSYSLDEATKTLTLTSATGAEYVIPDCEYTNPANSTKSYGILQQIAYDHDLSANVVLGKFDTVVIDQYATGFEAGESGNDYTNNAFTGFDQTKKFKVHCQSKLASKTAALAEFLDKLDAETTGNYTGTVEVKHEMEANKVKHNHKCKYGDFVDPSFTAHTFVPVEDGKTHLCECGKTDLDYKDAENVNAPDKNNPSLTVNMNGYEYIHDFVNHKCTECGAYNEVFHGDKKNLEIKADDAKTHSTKCVTDGCTYVEEKVAHTIAYATDDLIKDVNGVSGIKKYEHYCSVCGYHGADIQQHDYSYVKKPVLNEETGDYELEIVKAEAGKGVICQCGKINPDLGHKHEYIRENGYHYCLCGLEEETSSGETVHAYDNVKDPKTGKLRAPVAASNEVGVICECGKVDTAHNNCLTVASSHAGMIYADTTANKHICLCGKDVTADYHTQNRYTKLDTDNKQHVCATCGAVNPAIGGGHEYVQIVNDRTGALKTVGADTGIVCLCGAIKPGHEHTYTEPLANKTTHIHYCECGLTSTEHVYENHKCKICDLYEEHECEPDDSCLCTICGELAHDWQPITGKKDHVCAACGTRLSSYENDKDVFAAESAKAHEFVIDKTAHTHTCACGATGAHDYDAETCTCECGDTKHTRVANTATKTDTCSKCEAVLDHLYDDKGDTTCACGAIDPKHVTHTFYENAPNGDELCICGTKIAHEFALGDTAGGANNTAEYHDCIHTVPAVTTVKANGSTEAITTTTTAKVCNKTAAKHSFATAENSAQVFCTDCGAVNPVKLDLARSAATELTEMRGKYTSAYMVKLTKAIEAVEKYDIATEKDASQQRYTYKNSELDKILVAKTAEEQETFNTLLDTFTTIYGDKKNNKAGATVKAEYLTYIDDNGEVQESSAMGEIPVAYKEQYAGYGEVVTVKAIAKDGYHFVGWYDEDGALISESSECPVTTTIGETIVYAKFAMNDKVKIRINPGLTYKGTFNKNETAVKLAKDVDFYIGETVSLKMTPKTTTVQIDPTHTKTYDEKFQYIEDKYGYQHDYTDDNDKDDAWYSFVVTGPDTFTLASYNDSLVTDSEYYITFKNGTKVLSVGETINKSAETIKPNDPQAVGKKFVGWAYSDDTDKTIVRLKTIAKSGTLEPVFEALSGLKLTVKGGRFAKAADAETNKTGFTYQALVGLTADSQDAAGTWFTGWYVGDTIVSRETTFFYPVTASVTIEARYGGAEELVPESVYTLSSTRSITDKGQQVVLTANWAMSSDDAVNVIDTGYVFAFSEKTAADLVLGNVDGTNIRKKSTGMSSRKGVHNYTMNLNSAATKTATVYAVMYVTYTDVNGVQQTVYTENVEVVKPVSAN